MFTLLSPEQTGVVAENRYDDPKMWGEHYQELTLGATGTGIAIADYDADGLPDIFCVSKSGTCRLFRNLGDWKFEDVTAKAGLIISSIGAAAAGDRKEATETISPSDREAWRQGAVFADVNNDGWPDLYVCRFNSPNLLFVNQHDGTFKEEAAARGLAVVDACGVGAFCDYDRDGWLDVYVTTNMLDAVKYPNGRRGYLFHNNGDGVFTNVTVKAGIYGEGLSHSATWWDYDGDGWPDLYVANDFAEADRLYHNNRDGTFTDVVGKVLPHLPYSAMGADIGDVNNDGQMDLFVADMAATTHEKDHRGMAYSRTQGIAMADAPAASPPQYSRNALYLNTGVNRCLEVAQLAGVEATDWTWAPRFEDLDDDGWIDLFVTNGMIREFQNADLRDQIITAENLAERMRIMRSSPKLMEANLAYRNGGDLKFQEVGAAWGLNQRGVTFGCAFGDLDGDGDMDLVCSNYESGVTVLRNDSSSGHRLIVALSGAQSNRLGVGATVRVESALGTQMRTMVVARGYLSSSEPVLHFGLGADAIVDRLTVEWPSGQTQSFTHLPADRKFTITEPAGAPAPTPQSKTGSRAAQFSDVSQTFNLSITMAEASRQEAIPQPLMPVGFRNRGPALAVGDIDGDGRDDVLVAGTSGEPARLCTRKDDKFVPIDASELVNRSLVEDGPALLIDADGDGATDVLLTRGGTILPYQAPEYQPQLFLRDGQGGFHRATGAVPPLPVSAGAVAAADFDRSGRLSVFIGGRVRPGQYPIAPRSALLLNRGGRFEDVTDTMAPGLRSAGLVTSVLWSDVNGDGWPDLLLALEWGGIKYFQNEQGRSLVDRSDEAGFTSAGTGWWTSLASADFNQDGRPDFVAGNVGLNTQYRAALEHPALMYFGSFGPGRPQLVEAYYEGDKLFPRRTRKELGAVIPSVLQRYSRNDYYARATLPDILGAEKIAAARRFAVTELSSGVFLSQPDGTYRFKPLPRIAQVSPIQGMVAGDFDGDGHADLYVLENSYAGSPAGARFDSGLSQLLRGDGRGNFTPVTAVESGLIVTGDGKALVITDLDDDGWPDFIVTRNRESTLAWRNRGAAGGHSFSVRLRGIAGNPTAIGARVMVESTDGSVQTAEVSAGGGYYSQSTAALFFGYPDGSSPKKINVRWPDGTTSEHAISSPPAPAILISHP
jgi:hypothetical protein